MLAHGAGLCYIEEAFHAFYKEALGLTKLSARERARIGLLALIHRLLAPVAWLPLLIGLIVALKAPLFALARPPGASAAAR